MKIITNTAFALIFKTKYSEGFCINGGNFSIPLFYDKKTAQEARKQWGRLKPKVVEIEVKIKK